MGLVDEASELALRDGQRLLRVDLVDYREFGSRQSGQRETTAARLQRDSLAFRAQRNARLLGQCLENVEELPSRAQ